MLYNVALISSVQLQISHMCMYIYIYICSHVRLVRLLTFPTTVKSDDRRVKLVVGTHTVADDLT